MGVFNHFQRSLSRADGPWALAPRTGSGQPGVVDARERFNRAATARRQSHRSCTSGSRSAGLSGQRATPGRLRPAADRRRRTRRPQHRTARRLARGRRRGGRRSTVAAAIHASKADGHGPHSSDGYGSPAAQLLVAAVQPPAQRERSRRRCGGTDEVRHSQRVVVDGHVRSVKRRARSRAIVRRLKQPWRRLAASRNSSPTRRLPRPRRPRNPEDVRSGRRWW